VPGPRGPQARVPRGAAAVRVGDRGAGVAAPGHPADGARRDGPPALRRPARVPARRDGAPPRHRAVTPARAVTATRAAPPAPAWKSTSRQVGAGEEEQ